MNATTKPQILPIRFCTGGCSAGKHHAHSYSVDPVDGNLGKTFLCPGNLLESLEILDDDTDEPTGWGFIP